VGKVVYRGITGTPGNETEFYPNFASFPVVGQGGVLYVDQGTGNMYLWDGIMYDQTAGGGGGPSDTDGLPEGTTNLYYTDARVETVIGAASVNDLADVFARFPNEGDILYYTSGSWNNTPIEDVVMKQYKLLMDDVSATVSYIGEALPGSDVADPAWRIKKLDTSSDPEVQVTWADGTADFDKVWNDRATYTYS
jgi:hypothetical protein